MGGVFCTGLQTINGTDGYMGEFNSAGKATFRRNYQLVCKFLLKRLWGKIMHLRTELAGDNSSNPFFPGIECLYLF